MLLGPHYLPFLVTRFSGFKENTQSTVNTHLSTWVGSDIEEN